MERVNLSLENQNRKGCHPVYCQTEAGYCCKEEVLLGHFPANVAVRCDICGRWSRYPGKGAEHGQGEESGTEAG